MHVDDIHPGESIEQMECPNCGAPLNIDMKGVEIIALCCGARLEADALTLIDLLPEVEQPSEN